MPIFLILFFLFIFAIIRYNAKEIWHKIAYQTPLRKKVITREARERIQSYLKNINYYASLSPAGKEKFEDRLVIFMLNKEFIGRSELIVTEEMRVLISASAIQLTYGLTYFKLESLETIFIHPDTFHLSERSPEFKGATSGHVMHLSWKSFQEGYKISDDNLNLGLHEMTHALKLTLYLGHRFDEVFAGRMEYWEGLLSEQYKTLRTTPSFLRAYSKANTEEFFAVCTEAFFESPGKFKNELPEIYQSLVFLLNQDVLNKNNDYIISEGYFIGNKYAIPQPDEVKTSYKYSNYHWSINILIIGVFGFIPALLVADSWFMFPFQAFLFIGLLSGTLGLFQRKYFYERKIFSGVYFFLYSYFGFGAVVTIACVFLNFCVPISKTYKKKFSIGSLYGMPHFNHVDAIPDEDIESDVNMSAFMFPRRSYYAGRYEVEKGKYLVVKYHYGILGIKKVEDYYYTDTE